MLHRKCCAVLATMLLAMGMIACGEKDTEEAPFSGEEIVEVEEEFEKVVEPVDESDIIESVYMDDIQTAYEDAEPLPEGMKLIVDMDSVTVRKDGSVLVQAENGDGETIVLIYENEDAQKNNDNPKLAPADEVEMAIIEIIYR